MKLFKSFLVLALSLTLFGCASGNGDGSASDVQNKTSKNLKVGIIFSTGGLGDKNFNDMAYEGIERAKKELSIEFDYVEPKNVSDFINHYRMFAETGEYDLIIGIGADQVDAVAEIKPDFPDQKISIIDTSQEIEGVRSISTDWTEQTFLTGVIAGLETKANNLENVNDANVIGVILGKDFPNLKLGVVGYKAGAAYVNPEVEVLEAVVGDFADLAKSKEIASSMYSRNADFIQHIAGAAGLGVFNAAEANNKYAFGVGTIQNGEMPDNIVASATRNVADMVFYEVSQLVNDTWKAGVFESGLKEGAVGYSLEGSNVKLPTETVEIVEEIKEKIIKGELVTPKSEDELAEWILNNKYVKTK